MTVTIEGWEPYTLLGRPVPDHQRAVLSDPRGVSVTVWQNGWEAFQAIIRITDEPTETDVQISWPHAEPDHSVPVEEVKAWAEANLDGLLRLFGPPTPEPQTTTQHLAAFEDGPNLAAHLREEHGLTGSWMTAPPPGRAGFVQLQAMHHREHDPI